MQTAFNPKPRPCGYEPCGREFTPTRPMQTVCSSRCALRKARADRQGKEAAERAETKARKEKDRETIPYLIKVADRAFAAFIRERDRQAGFPCISSGRLLDWSGNQVDAGHYRSRGAASHLRYHEDNCHAQSKEQNRFKAGNAVDYRINLIGRVGLERVEALEADNEPHKWTTDELKAIAATYRKKLKELKEQA